MEKLDNSEEILIELLKQSALKIPSSDFTSKLMLQIAYQNNLKAKMLFKLKLQIIVFLSVAVLVSAIAWSSIFFNYSNISFSSQAINSMTSYISIILKYMMSNINVLMYCFITFTLLMLADFIYAKFLDLAKG